MRTITFVAVLVAAFAACAGGSAATATARTDLTITVWGKGRPGANVARTLRCQPNGGTLPYRDTACRRLYAMTAPFRPVPEDAICTAIYGGPQEAHVRGTFRGRRVDAWFNRRNGCEIARWDRVAFLFRVTR